MKIILSPSKSRNYATSKRALSDRTRPIFEKEAAFLADTIKSYSKDQLSKIMNIKNDLLDRTFEAYIEFYRAETRSAISSYTGTLYKELDLENYNQVQLDYLESNVKILSALYGILRAFDAIQDYRLDMTMKVLDTSLYNYWKGKINRELIVDQSEELIINLSSKEFSKMLVGDYINIEFKQGSEGAPYKTVAFHSKKARGMMANYLIVKNIKTLKGLKAFNCEGYQYNPVLSSSNNLVFTRHY